jgi:hypothetical protein
MSQPVVSAPARIAPARGPLRLQISDRLTRVGWVAVALLAGLYLLQVVTPLRIDNDSVVYLQVALQLAGEETNGGGNVPIGYPVAIAGLVHLGLESAAAFVLFNATFIALGFAAVWWIGRDVSPTVRVVAIALSLLSYPIVRVNVMPHPDAMGFGLMLIVVAMLSSVTRERSRRNAMLLLAATAITMIASTVRIAALVLVIPLAWCVLKIAVPGDASRRTHILIGLAIVVALGASVAVAIGLSEQGTFSRYEQEIEASVNKRSAFQLALNRVTTMLRGIAEVTVNLPTVRWPQIRPYLWIPGLFPAVFLFATRKLAPWSRPVSVYVIAYLFMLTVWPFFTTRLWVPLIPLIILHATHAAFELRQRRALRGVLTVCASWLIFTGLVALAWTSRISLAGENFRSRWGVNGGFAHPGHEASGHNQRAVEVARRFDGDNPAWRTILD